MRYNKVILLNGTFSGGEHEIIDSSFIIAFAMIAKEVTVYYQPKRKKIIKGLVYERIEENNILYKDIWNFPNRVRITIREFVAAIQECFVFLTKANRETLTCLTYINRFNGYGLNFLSKITRKPLLILAHGELKLIRTQPQKGEINWVKMVRYFYSHTQLSSYVKIAVLGDYIRENMLSYCNKQNVGKYISIDHPYFATSTVVYHQMHHPIRIGVIGFVKRESERGFENIKKMARVISNDEDFELRLLSNVQPELVKELPQTVKLLNSTNRFVPRDEYDKMIEELDYIYCPYPTGSFKMVASGALLEALAKGKPVIMHDNEYGRYLRKKYGEFGIVVDDMNFERIKDALKQEKQYEQRILRQEDVLKQLSPDILSSILDSICETI